MISTQRKGQKPAVSAGGRAAAVLLFYVGMIQRDEPSMDEACVSVGLDRKVQTKLRDYLRIIGCKAEAKKGRSVYYNLPL